MDEEIDFEGLELLILEIENNILTNKEHNFVFA